MKVWRFDDGTVRSHVIAADREEAIQLFDKRMGPEYRDEADAVMMIYPIKDNEILRIDLLNDGDFTEKTAFQWMQVMGKGFL